VQYERVTRSWRSCAAASPRLSGDLRISVYASFETDAVAAFRACAMPKPNERNGRRTRGAGGRIRPRARTLHRPQFVGHVVGMDGYFTMPYAYLTDGNLATIWTIKLVQWIGMARAPSRSTKRGGAADVEQREVQGKTTRSPAKSKKNR